MDKYTSSKDGLMFFTSYGLSILSITLAIYAINLMGDEYMTGQLPWWVTMFITVGIISILVAIGFGIEMYKALKEAKQQKESKGNATTPISITLNLSGDLSQMKAEQIKAIKYITDKTQK
jgi:hypothetical protein